MGQNSKTQIVTKLKINIIVTKLKNSNGVKTQIVTKLENSNCDKTQKKSLGQNSKTQIVTELINSNCDKTQKLKN